MKEEGRDLLTEFRQLAPKRRPVSIQRWSFRRALLTAQVVLLGLLALLLVANNWNAFA